MILANQYSANQSQQAYLQGKQQKMQADQQAEQKKKQEQQRLANENFNKVMKATQMRENLANSYRNSVIDGNTFAMVKTFNQNASLLGGGSYAPYDTKNTAHVALLTVALQQNQADVDTDIPAHVLNPKYANQFAKSIIIYTDEDGEQTPLEMSDMLGALGFSSIVSTSTKNHLKELYTDIFKPRTQADRNNETLQAAQDPNLSSEFREYITDIINTSIEQQLKERKMDLETYKVNAGVQQKQNALAVEIKHKEDTLSHKDKVLAADISQDDKELAHKKEKLAADIKHKEDIHALEQRKVDNEEQALKQAGLTPKLSKHQEELETNAQDTSVLDTALKTGQFNTTTQAALNRQLNKQGLIPTYETVIKDIIPIQNISNILADYPITTLLQTQGLINLPHLRTSLDKLSPNETITESQFTGMLSAASNISKEIIPLLKQMYGVLTPGELIHALKTFGGTGEGNVNFMTLVSSIITQYSKRLEASVIKLNKFMPSVSQALAENKLVHISEALTKIITITKRNVALGFGTTQQAQLQKLQKLFTTAPPNEPTQQKSKRPKINRQ